MRKKLLALLAVVAVMAVVLSVTTMAADGSALPNEGVVNALFDRLILSAKMFFGVIEKIYVFFRDVYC